MVNGRGPFRFVLDTGANRSVLSPRVTDATGLTPSLETPIRVHGVTGTAVLPTVLVDEIRAGKLSVVRAKRMPVLSGPVLADADGILGIEGLSRSRIDIDFENGTVTIARSPGTPADEGMRVVPVTLRHGGLLIADARVGGVRVKAIIDTGAERTLGNMALLAEIDPARARRIAAATVHGATAELTQGTSFIAPPIRLGSIVLEDLEVTFGELHVFRLWDLQERPALLIGMDLIGTVRRFSIDYRRKEVHVMPWPRASEQGG
jgi:predicted aspartyl protease